LAARESTEARIVNGTLRALARQGPKKVTMSDIAAEASVSPGTLYRYFKNKDDILQALGNYYLARLRDLLQQAIADAPDPGDRLRVVFDIWLRYWQDNPQTVQLGQMEPGFVIGYIKSVMPQLQALLHDALEPVLVHESPAVRLGLATPDEIVDLLVRIAFSNHFIPAHEYGKLRDLCITIVTADGIEAKKPRAGSRRKAAS
jgi:AcrR family transcriptional regulator